MFTIFFALCPLNISSTCNSLKPLKESIFRDTKGHGQEHPLLYQANQSHLYSLNHLIQYIYTKQVFSFFQITGCGGGSNQSTKIHTYCSKPTGIIATCFACHGPSSAKLSAQASSEPMLLSHACQPSLGNTNNKKLQIMLSASLCSLSLQNKAKACGCTSDVTLMKQ